MITIKIRLAAAISHHAPTVLRSQSFSAEHWTGTTAELIERPSGTSNQAFAQHLLEMSALRPWNGPAYELPAFPGRWGVVSVVSGAGPEITVYYLLSDGTQSGRVCRISRKYGGMTDAWKNAQDWCARNLGLPPLKRVPPIRTVNEPLGN